MRLAAGKIPYEPGVYVSEQQLAALGLFACTVYIVEYPLDLRAGKVRVDEKSGLIADVITDALCLEFIADRCCSSALPDDGVIYGLSGILVPDDCRLALICYAYTGYVGR